MLIIIPFNVLYALGKCTRSLSLSLSLLLLGESEKNKTKQNKIKEMIGCKERSMLVLSELQLNKMVGNVQSIFSIGKAILELFDKCKDSAILTIAEK